MYGQGEPTDGLVIERAMNQFIVLLARYRWRVCLLILGWVDEEVLHYRLIVAPV